MQILFPAGSITQNKKFVKVFFDTISNNCVSEGKIFEEPQSTKSLQGRSPWQSHAIASVVPLGLLRNDSPCQFTCERYVPSCQDERYFFCSGVKLSIFTPRDANLS